MENETTEELNIIKKISNIVIKKKKLFLSFAFIIIAILSLIVFLNYYQTTQNNKISEKYVKAGIYLSSKDNEKSKSIYKEIILSKNKFYSILALYSIIEKDLITDQKKILNYFDIIEKIKKEDEQVDIINFKKALYLIKSGNKDKGQLILKKLTVETTLNILMWTKFLKLKY